MRTDYLTSGKVWSCGCYNNQLCRQLGHANLKHGHNRDNDKRSKAYNCWSNMIRRCTEPTNSAWKHYGGRGISVCDRWRTFENFLADMGEPPPSLTLDRISVDGNYTPGNCRWADRHTQRVNQRPLTKGWKLSADDVRTIRAAEGSNAEIGRRFGVVASVISNIRNKKTWRHVT